MINRKIQTKVENATVTLLKKGGRLAKLALIVPLFGYSDISGPQKLLSRYQILTFSPPSFGHDVQNKIKKLKTQQLLY